MFSYIVKDYKQVDKIMTNNNEEIECLYFGDATKKDPELKQVFNIQQAPFLLFIQKGKIIEMSYLE